MPDRPDEEGIQPEAIPPRPRGSRTEPRRAVGEGQTYHAEFSVSLEDAMAFYDHALRAATAQTTKPQKRSLKVNFIFGGIALGLVAVSLARREGLMPAWVEAVLPCLGWMILGAFLGLFTVGSFWNRITRANVRRGFENDRDLFVTHRYTLTPEAVHYTIGKGVVGRRQGCHGV